MQITHLASHEEQRSDQHRYHYTNEFEAVEMGPVDEGR